MSQKIQNAIASGISDRPSSPLVILRRVYLDITGNHCAAKLIEYFKHWRNWKLKNHRTDWVYLPLKRIYEDLMQEHSLHVIRAAIAVLMRLGILERRSNPGNKQDKTWQYRLNWAVLQELTKSKRRKFNSEPGEFNVEQQQQNLTTNIKPTTDKAAEISSGIEASTTVSCTTACDNFEVPDLELGTTLEDNSSAAPTNSPKITTPDAEAILEAVESAGISLNKQLYNTVLKYSLDDVQSAIAYYRQVVKDKGRRKNPAGWLTECLKGQWWISATITEENFYPKGFLEAYQQLIAARIVEDVPPSWLPKNMGDLEVRFINPNAQLGECPYVLMGWRDAMSFLEQSLMI